MSAKRAVLAFDPSGDFLAPLIAQALHQPAAIDPHKFYSAEEVAAMLGVSYATALRRMSQMGGCIDLGSKERRYRRGKRMLRISGKRLRTYLDGKQI